MIVEIRKREDPGDEVVWQTNKKGKKKRFRLCRCFRRWFQVIKFTMPYIFVRSSMNQNGLFSNQTFIDFENVATENGQPLSTFLVGFFGSQQVIGSPDGTRLENLSYFTHEQNQPQTCRVSDSPPHLVLNKLEHLGYKVVAANSQRPGSTASNNFVAYNVWTLHKPPLAWTTTDIRLHTANTFRERTSWTLTLLVCV